MNQTAERKPAARVRKKSMFFETLGRVFKTPSAKLGGILLGLILLLTLFARFIAPYTPYQMDFAHQYSRPTSLHWCGTDAYGRDIFSRLLYGARESLFLGLMASFVGNFGGVVVGSIAGYFGGLVETLIMRFCDIWQALPGMLMTIVMSAVFGPGLFNTILAMSIGSIPGGARMTRGQILAERGKEYLEAAEVINCSTPSIVFGHLLPNVISPTLVGATMAVGGTITGAAGLSYLGLGVQPPSPEWGAMLSDGATVFQAYPHMVLFPGIAIGITVFAINLIGDGVRDALDPKMKS